MNKAVVSRLFDEVYNRGDLDALDELLSPDFVGDDPRPTPGIAAYKETQASVRAQYERYFRAFAWELTDVAAEGALTFVRMTFRGQQISDDKPDVTMQGFFEASLAEGKIVRVWSLVDVASLTAQLSAYSAATSPFTLRLSLDNKGQAISDEALFRCV